MKYADATRKLASLQKELRALRKEMAKVRKAAQPQPVEDYQFTRASGEKVRLSELFGGKEHLFVVHNMGASCPYCTLWADGFNGVNDHLQDRAAFVVATPDAPRKQVQFAASRGWKFPMVSHAGTSFAADMGYAGKDGFYPGVSVFARKNGAIVRVSDDSFAPGDDYCGLWHLFALLPGKPGWQPKYVY
jgi:predicted dithiol-disulfide oxidoreductase (DUF899 family)